MGTYLDHNATTPLDERVLETMLPYLRMQFGNPSSVYRRGRQARQAVEMAREQIAQWVNVQPSQVVFTSGGTEANNLALKGLASEMTCLAVSAVEHASVITPARQLTFRGCQVETIAVDSNGQVTEASMMRALAAKPQLVSVMAANNETGVLQDIPRLAALAKTSGALFHTDAVQMAGKMPLDFEALGVNLMTLSAHKIYGPKGSGALIVDRHTGLAPELSGGGQERGLRSGTENVAAIVGFGMAAELAKSELTERHTHLKGLRQRLEQQLQRIKEVVVFAQQVERLPNTVFMAVPGIDGETLLMELDRAGIEIASGSACDSQKNGPSHVLTAMGVDETLARCAVRVSVGQKSTEAEIDALVVSIREQIKALQASSMLAWA